MMRFSFFTFMILGGAALFILSSLHIDIFTYKDSHRLERLVVTSRDESLSEQFPSFPEGLGKDERLEHKEGLTGLGSYGINKIKDYFPPKEEDGKGVNASQQANIPRMPHSVGKPTGEGISEGTPDVANENQPLEAPSVPDSIEVKENPTVGTSAVGDLVQNHYEPDVTIQKIKRFFEEPHSILVGSFCVDPLRPHHLEQKEFLEDFLSVIAQFDLLAIQGIYTEDSAILKELCGEASRRTGRQYTYTVVFPKNPSRNRPVPVFLFDQNVLEVDPSTIQLVGQVNNPFAFPPLAAQFRVKKAPVEKAFTFIAVNMQAFPGYENQEMQYIPSVMMRLKDSISKGNFDREDDVILFGYFGLEPRKTVVADQQFNQTITWANPEFPTNTFGSFSYVAENILFQTEPLAEYDNRSGIWDLRKQFHRPDKIPFDHHPVWACFSIYEGGQQ